MNYLFNGPENADITFVYAHGAGAHMDSKFMERVAHGLGERAIRVVRFEFPYMQKRRETGKKRPPDRTPKLLNAWRDIITDLGGPDKLFIGGKSLGGRMATMIGAELEEEGTPVNGICVTGYPFHPLGKSEKEHLRVDHLMKLKTPTLICQGARDSFGWWDEVVEYGLPDTIDFHWADDGDHDLKPRVLSGRTMKENQMEAVEAIASWLKAHV
jgi:predicted alpha/beta-hydrolase family hydrolase